MKVPPGRANALSWQLAGEQGYPLRPSSHYCGNVPLLVPDRNDPNFGLSIWRSRFPECRPFVFGGASQIELTVSV